MVKLTRDTVRVQHHSNPNGPGHFKDRCDIGHCEHRVSDEIGMGELIKIGWTSNLEPRMSHLHADAVLFTRPGTKHDEKALHAKFNHLLVKGREWFRSDPELLDFISRLH